MTTVLALRSLGRGWRGPIRRLGLGLSTLLGLRRAGFFVPYRYAGRTEAAGAALSYAAAAAVLDRHGDDFARVLGAIDGFGTALTAIGQTGEASAVRPRWGQDWFPRLDAAAAYSLVRTHRPRRIVEVGSGHSTRFLLRAIEDGRLATHLTAIDPDPRAELPGEGVEVRRGTIQDIGTAPFAALEPGDFVIIDSSHVLMPGSDVDILVNGVLPALPPGVYVHFHDIFLPDGYPAEWRWRAYNEQSLVATLLLGAGYAPVFASHYVATRMAALVAKSVVGTLPLAPGARDSSLWLLKRPVGAPAS